MAEPSNLITALILERPMCLSCLSQRTRLSAEATQTALTVIGSAVHIHRQHRSQCLACGTVGEVFHVERPPLD
jgi:hypothetical protein